MPEMPPEESPFILYTQQALHIAGGALGLINGLFVVATVLGLLRFVFLVYFSGRQARRRPGLSSGSELPTPVSAVIAAYNEEEVICRTVQSVLDSDHPVGEIIIVNDGSTDRTSAVIRKAFKDHPQVLLLEQENSGKSAAVNWGFRTASNEIVVAFDADTIVGRQSIGHLVQHFHDPRVGAVSGNIRVGNVHNLLTKWQHIEYVIGFNLERRAFDELNCVTVVPGAMGAWRKSAVAACGYFPEDTLAEDTDVTLSLLQNGLHVTYEPRAVAFTEAPSDLRSLFKQRTRWTYGTLQCLWKHRRALLSGKHKALGWIALPSMWVFQFGFQLLAPLADLVFLAAMAAGQVQTVLLYYGLFLLIDYLAALRAFRLEGENPRVLVWLFLQRIIYRMIIMLVIIKSILMAIRGIPVGWNKLRRKGDVTIDSLITDCADLPRRRQPVTT
jgi:cellulose synthase/poly-beta-1,6-N-acetylglucosamine synthase-like glycosyltransferase